MKIKTKFILTIIVLVLMVFFGVGYYLNNQLKQKQQFNFFEENNIEDDAPVGRDLENNWLYRTRDNQIIKSKIIYPTERGLEYKALVEGEFVYGEQLTKEEAIKMLQLEEDKNSDYSLMLKKIINENAH